MQGGNLFSGVLLPWTMLNELCRNCLSQGPDNPNCCQDAWELSMGVGPRVSNYATFPDTNRTTIQQYVPETNVLWHIFFKALGFHFLPARHNQPGGWLSKLPGIKHGPHSIPSSTTHRRKKKRKKKPGDQRAAWSLLSHLRVDSKSWAFFLSLSFFFLVMIVQTKQMARKMR